MIGAVMASLNHRARAILTAIIEEFIATGEPVSSRSVTKRAGLELSAATIRNVMAELEESGLLAQPHTSAGRVPTEEALRYFVSSLMRPQEPAAEDLALLRSECDRTAGDPEELMRTAVRTLSLLGQAAGLVTTPRIESAPLATLRFIPVRSGTLLAVMVTRTGMVHERAIHASREIDAAELERVHNYLNELVAGRSLVELREVMRHEITDATAGMDRMRQEALALGIQALEVPEAAGLHVEGQEHLLGRAEFSDAGMLRTAVLALADRSRLLELLESTIEADGLHIVIGAQAGIESLAGLTVITARYGDSAQPSGRLGLLGPSRMDYAKAVALVTHTAKLVSILLEQDRQ
jgi:heat-inducible transcriptional repressor